MTRLVNLMPHPLRMYRASVESDVLVENEEPVLVVPPDGPPARLAEITLGTQLSVGGASVELVEYGRVHDLPPRRDGVAYVVSLLVALAARRDDLLSPYRLVRNAEGTVVGCRQLAQPV